MTLRGSKRDRLRRADATGQPVNATEAGKLFPPGVLAALAATGRAVLSVGRRGNPCFYALTQLTNGDVRVVRRRG